MKQYIHIKSGNLYHIVGQIIMKDHSGMWYNGIQYQADYPVECVNNFACSIESFYKRFADPDEQKMPDYLWHPNGQVNHVEGHLYRRSDGKEFNVWKNIKGDWIDATGKSKVSFTSPDDLPF